MSRPGGHGFDMATEHRCRGGKPNTVRGRNNFNPFGGR